MSSLVSPLNRALRVLIAGAALFVAAGQAYVADAAVQYAATGTPGSYDIIDSSGSPGARCYYNVHGSLYDLLVIRPHLYARSDYVRSSGGQPVSFRARPQWLYADGRQDVVDSNAATYQHSPVSRAVGTNYAAFDHLNLIVSVSPTATVRAFVDLVAEWRNPQTNQIEAARAFYVTYYRKYQVMADGSQVFRGDVTGGCPANL